MRLASVKTFRTLQGMKHLLSCFILLLAACQSSQDYHARSVAEAKAFAAKAVQSGVIHKGGEQALIAKTSTGKPLDGKWNQAKIDRYISEFVAQNPRLVRINLAATQGKISEADRVFYTEILKNQKEREAEQKTAAIQDMSSGLNQSAATINQGSFYRYNSALMQNNPSSGYPGYGAGLGGMGVGGLGY